MKEIYRLLLLLFSCLFSAALLPDIASSANFTDLFQPYWAPDHIVAVDGQPLKLQLDNASGTGGVVPLIIYFVSFLKFYKKQKLLAIIFAGCGFASKNKYLFGQVSMDIKLVEGDSAGTVTAFYVSSR